MKSIFIRLILILVLAVTFPGRAQEIESVTWKGTATLHNKRTENVEYEILLKNSDETVDLFNSIDSINMYYKEAIYPLNDLRIDNDQVSFELDMGTLYQCVLQSNEEGVYSGVCPAKSKTSQRKISIVMNSPNSETIDEMSNEANDKTIDSTLLDISVDNKDTDSLIEDNQ